MFCFYMWSRRQPRNQGIVFSEDTRLEFNEVKLTWVAKIQEKVKFNVGGRYCFIQFDGDNYGRGASECEIQGYRGTST